MRAELPMDTVQQEWLVTNTKSWILKVLSGCIRCSLRRMMGAIYHGPLQMKPSPRRWEGRLRPLLLNISIIAFIVEVLMKVRTIENSTRTMHCWTHKVEGALTEVRKEFNWVLSANSPRVFYAKMLAKIVKTLVFTAPRDGISLDVSSSTLLWWMCSKQNVQNSMKMILI